MLLRFAVMVTSIMGMSCISSRPGYITKISKQSIKLINFDPSQSSHDMEMIEGLLKTPRGLYEEHPTIPVSVLSQS